MSQPDFFRTAGVFALHIGKFHTFVPFLFGGHLAAEEFHDYVHAADAVAYVVGEIGADAEGGADAVAAILLYAYCFFNI